MWVWVLVCVWVCACVSWWADDPIKLPAIGCSAIPPDIQPQTLNMAPQKPQYQTRSLSTNTSSWAQTHTQTHTQAKSRKNQTNCCDIYRFVFMRWQQKLFLMPQIHLPISTSFFRLYAAYTQFYGICSLSCFQLVLPGRKLYWLLRQNIWLIFNSRWQCSAQCTVVK